LGNRLLVRRDGPIIFILGGSGFFGSALARACQAMGKPCAAIGRANYAEYVGRPCDVLINANGNSRKYLARESPLEEFDASVRSVRASLVDFRPGRYVFISSADIYPDCGDPAATAEDQRPDPGRQTPYGFHKYLAEQCVRHAARDWLILRGGGFVGPGLKKNPVYDVLHGDALWVTADSELQFLDTDRAAGVVLQLLDRGANRDVFNLCAHGVVSPAQVMQWSGRSVPVRPGSPRVRCELDLRKLSALVDLPRSADCVREYIRSASAQPGASA
jgi:nucleoside-diphosphate-sugar epimerase